MAQSEHLQALYSTFSEVHKEIKVSWKQTLSGVLETINSVIIRESHSETKIPLEYRKDNVTNAIVVGGTSCRADIRWKD